MTKCNDCDKPAKYTFREYSSSALYDIDTQDQLASCDNDYEPDETYYCEDCTPLEPDTDI